MTVSNNSFPLNILNTLGIKVKASEDQGPHLPEKLGTYLDNIIQKGDRDSLYQVAEQVLTEAKNIATQHPRVTMNALIAMNQSETSLGNEVGREYMGNGSSVNWTLAKYHSNQKAFYTEIAKTVGINDDGLMLSITERTKFNAFLKAMKDSNIELTQDDKKFFEDLIKDDFLMMINSLEDNVGAKHHEAIFEKADTVKLLIDLSLTEITTTETETKVPLSRIQRGLRTIGLGVQDGRDPTKLLNAFQKVLAQID